jgi:hypothetical protein
MCSTDAAMQKQLFSITDSLNSIVNKATTTLTTSKKGDKGSTNYLTELKAAYDKAKYNLSTAPSNVKTTKKAYIVAKDGEVEYEQIIKEENYKSLSKSKTKISDFNSLECLK